jgi:hypothetical protein
VDIACILQLRPEADADAGRARAVLEDAARRLGLDPAPQLDEVGQATFVGVNQAQVEEALDAADPRWRDELFQWAH